LISNWERVVDGKLCTVVLDIKVGSKLGMVADRELCTVLVPDIKLGSKLGTVLDRRHRRRRTVVVVDIKVGSALDKKLKWHAIVIVVIKNTIRSFGAEIGAALGSKLGSILGIALGIELGTALGSELGTAKSKMNISVPTGN
jgi:hypothetical protein